jgi:lipoic acid synthetase
LRVEKFYTPDEFAEFKRIGLELGFRYVESGPLVRSSYHAHEHVPDELKNKTMLPVLNREF